MSVAFHPTECGLCRRSVYEPPQPRAQARGHGSSDSPPKGHSENSCAVEFLSERWKRATMEKPTVSSFVLDVICTVCGGFMLAVVWARCPCLPATHLQEKNGSYRIRHTGVLVGGRAF